MRKVLTVILAFLATLSFGQTDFQKYYDSLSLKE
ncbi:hypothetical protein SAMN05444280_10593 [Tangfeifania diversioriginum]|uniref:Uncharacterized protein n=1 Tax=Tangfeifania diversioriginum TaxID=1168035 RepID=A0A1M6DL36_9BACT|nr:hypothetical protein SAMN05444280_10593 [Tangfeifania diversioriginum]